MFNFVFFFNFDQPAIYSKRQRKCEFPLNKIQCCFRFGAVSVVIMKYVCHVSLKIITPWFPSFYWNSGLEMDLFCSHTFNLFLASLLYSADISVVGKTVVWHFKATFFFPNWIMTYKIRANIPDPLNICVISRKKQSWKLSNMAPIWISLPKVWLN